MVLLPIRMIILPLLEKNTMIPSNLETESLHQLWVLSLLFSPPQFQEMREKDSVSSFPKVCIYVVSFKVGIFSFLYNLSLWEPGEQAYLQIDIWMSRSIYSFHSFLNENIHVGIVSFLYTCKLLSLRGK